MLSQPTELILSVDDTPANLDVISDLLSAAGFEVAVAPSGERAFKQLNRQLPDLILLDVMMPGIDGFEVCQRLKADPRTQEIPIIFITALADTHSMTQGFELGAVDYIIKPFQNAEVLARVTTHLQLRRLTKHLEQQIAQRTADLEQANQQLAAYSQILEQKVAERTAELSQTLTHLQATQQELIQAEKLAALGQLTASVAHEINTPLGVIRGATDNIVAAFEAALQQLPDLWQALSPPHQTAFLALVQAALQQKQQPLSSREERQLRSQLETKLTAQGLANAPRIATHLTLLRLGPDLQSHQAILQAPNCLELLQVAYNLVLQQQSTSSIQQEVDRAAKIVFGLKAYSYGHEQTEQSLVRLTDSLEAALTLYQNRLKQGISLSTGQKLAKGCQEGVS